MLDLKFYSNLRGWVVDDPLDRDRRRVEEEGGDYGSVVGEVHMDPEDGRHPASVESFRLIHSLEVDYATHGDSRSTLEKLCTLCFEAGHKHGRRLATLSAEEFLAARKTKRVRRKGA